MREDEKEALKKFIVACEDCRIILFQYYNGFLTRKEFFDKFFEHFESYISQYGDYISKFFRS